MTAAEERTWTTTGRTLVRCTTCKTAGWIHYTATTRQWATHTGLHSDVTYHHEPTGTWGSARTFDRFVLTAARATHTCGNRLKPIHIKATVNEKRPCDARCIGAVGPVCSCSCGGENHGDSWTTW